MRRGFNLSVRKISWTRKWQPTPVFLPGKSHGQRSLVGYSPWGRERVGLATKQQQHRKDTAFLCISIEWDENKITIKKRVKLRDKCKSKKKKKIEYIHFSWVPMSINTCECLKIHMSRLYQHSPFQSLFRSPEISICKSSPHVEKHRFDMTNSVTTMLTLSMW